MNFIADRMILAGYAIVGCLASYATYKILTKFLVKPMLGTYRFLTNQSRDMASVIDEKYGKDLAIIAGGRSGMSTTWAAYLANLGFKTILLIGGDQEKLDKQKKVLEDERKNEEMQILTFKFDFAKRSEASDKNALSEYVTKLMSENEHHCSILINNIALCQEQYQNLAPLQLGNLTQIKINLHSFITKLVMIDLRNQGLRKKRGLVINIGTTQEHLVKNAVDYEFENIKEQNEWEVYKSTIDYWTNISTLKERNEAVEVDFIKDAPNSQRQFADNLSYLGIELTPGTHVDQVMR